MMIELGDAGVLAPGRWRWARALGWMVALFALVILATMLPMLVRLWRPGDRAPIAIAAALATLLCYAAYGLAVRRGEKRDASEIVLPPLPRDLAIGLLIGLGMFTLVFASLRLLGVYAMARGVWSDWPRDIVEALEGGLVEELLIRAIVFRLVMRAFGPWPALGFSAVLFGGLHLLNPNATATAAAAIAIEAGLMLASFYLLTGRIWMSVGVHAAWNFAQGSIFGARVSGIVETGSFFTSAPMPGSPDWLSGGPFGPEASLPAVIVGFAVFLIVLAAARRRGALA